MHVGRLVFAQVMDLLPLSDFRRCVARYPERRPGRKFSCLDQFLCMAFAQLSLVERKCTYFTKTTSGSKWHSDQIGCFLVMNISKDAP